MSITERSAISPGAHLAVGRLAEGLGGREGLGEASFRRRLGSSKSPSAPRLPRARLQQLLQEPLQEESPKGLNRALTPSMLKVVRRADKRKADSDELVVAPKTSGVMSPWGIPFTEATGHCVHDKDDVIYM
jgi:hypothetical protein